MKQLTPQILALYLGCEIIVGDGRASDILLGISYSPPDASLYDGLNHKSMYATEFMPVLRPLSSMTEEEAAQVGKIVFGKHDSVKWRSRPERNDKGDVKYFTVYRKYYELFLTIDVPSGEIECYRENRESPGLDDKEIYNNQHKVTAYLLSKSFDLFGLIEAGLAIDKK